MSSIDIQHDEQSVPWQNTTDRVKVFSVTKPNPAHERWEEVGGEPGEEEPPRELVVDYTMPAKPNAGIALQYLKRARVNADMAASWLLELALGSEGYDALTDELAAESDPEKAADTMTAIVKFVAQRALGGLSGKA